MVPEACSELESVAVILMAASHYHVEALHLQLQVYNSYQFQYRCNGLLSFYALLVVNAVQAFFKMGKMRGFKVTGGKLMFVILKILMGLK